jgi:hypothetical protein
MLGKNVVDAELKRGFGLSIKENRAVLESWRRRCRNEVYGMLPLLVEGRRSRIDRALYLGGF